MTMEQSGERPAAEGPGDDALDTGQSRPGETGAGDLAGLTPEQVQAKLREAREDAQRNWQHFLHSAADLENYKKQAARERQEAVDRTRRQMLSLVLGVLDNLERALAFGNEHKGPGKALVDGLRMTHRQILAQIEALGVRPIDAVGKTFDPRLHEAVSVVSPQDAGAASGTIVGEALKGYLMNDDVLRPAKVTVVGEGTREREHR